MDWNKTLAACLIGITSMVPAACADEDGDGAVSDEEIERVDEFIEDIAEEFEEEAAEVGRELED